MKKIVNGKETDCTQEEISTLSAEWAANVARELDLAAVRSANEVQRVEDEAAKTSTKAEAVVQYLVNHTPAESEAYVLSHVTDLASAKVILGKMAMALSVLCKAELR